MLTIHAVAVGPFVGPFVVKYAKIRENSCRFELFSKCFFRNKTPYI